MTARKVSVLNNMQLPEICQKIISMVGNRDNHSTVIELQSDDGVDPEVSIPSWRALLTH